MRRAAGSLIPIEVSILESLIALRARGVGEAHGYAIAQALKARSNARQLTAYGTLYKALERLERSGLLASTWESPDTAAADGRPRRRYYRVTVEGAAALASEAARESPALPAGARPART